MQANRAVAAALLVFVAACLGAIIVKGRRSADSAAGPPPAAAAGEQPAAEPTEMQDGLIVYYFHATMRCPTCRTIESYAHDVIESAFRKEIADGRIRWRVINYESPGQEHFLQDYNIVFPTVVLVRVRNGQEDQWRNLERVWELVGEPAAFAEYIETNARELLGE